jgi:hypothetical protein
MEIKITGCSDCPARNCDLTLGSYCSIVKKKIELRKNQKVKPWCPLKKEPITVKLQDDSIAVPIL